jgi:hypothetical protein
MAKKSASKKEAKMHAHHAEIRKALAVLTKKVPGFTAPNVPQILSGRVHAANPLEFDDATFSAGTCGNVLAVSVFDTLVVYRVKLDGDGEPFRLIFDRDLSAGCTS